MTWEITEAHNEARLAATLDTIDAGADNGTIAFYATARPSLGGSPGGAPLVVVVLASPCGTIADGKLSLAQDDDTGDQITTSGAAVWARIFNGDGVGVADGDVGYIRPAPDEADTGTWKDINLAGTSGTTLYAGGYVLLGTTKLG